MLMVMIHLQLNIWLLLSGLDSLLPLSQSFYLFLTSMTSVIDQSIMSSLHNSKCNVKDSLESNKVQDIRCRLKVSLLLLFSFLPPPKNVRFCWSVPDGQARALLVTPCWAGGAFWHQRRWDQHSCQLRHCWMSHDRGGSTRLVWGVCALRRKHLTTESVGSVWTWRTSYCSVSDPSAGLHWAWEESSREEDGDLDLRSLETHNGVVQPWRLAEETWAQFAGAYPIRRPSLALANGQVSLSILLG